jgi:hypothetical protein
LCNKFRQFLSEAELIGFQLINLSALFELGDCDGANELYIFVFTHRRKKIFSKTEADVPRTAFWFSQKIRNLATQLGRTTNKSYQHTTKNHFN